MVLPGRPIVAACLIPRRLALEKLVFLVITAGTIRDLPRVLVGEDLGPVLRADYLLFLLGEHWSLMVGTAQRVAIAVKMHRALNVLYLNDS